jgi:hypothetical protein
MPTIRHLQKTHRLRKESFCAEINLITRRASTEMERQKGKRMEKRQMHGKVLICNYAVHHSETQGLFLSRGKEHNVF